MKWILLTLIMAVTSLKMKLTLEAEETRCFYQMLMSQQKYAVELVPINEGIYQLDIKHQVNSSWEHSVYRKTEKPFQKVSLYKLAKHQTLYSYCITNLDISPLRVKTQIRWGIELLDLKAIAQESDQERLQNEAKWIEKQATKIEQAVKNTFAKRSDRDEYANLMRKKMIGYALIGMFVLVGISVYFYMNLRKTFHERKMI